MMKKVLAAVLTLLSAQLSYPQQKYLLDSVINRWTHYDARTQIEHQRYDPDKGILVYQSEVLDGSGDRAEGIKQITRYDSRGNKLMFIDSYWSDQKEHWIKRAKKVYTYDDQNRILSETEYEMQGEIWVGSVSKQKEYDEKSSIVTLYRWNGKSWIPTSRTTTFFNDCQKDMLTFTYQWDSKDSTWIYWTQREMIYTQDTLLQEVITYTWNGGRWLNDEKIELKYVPETNSISDSVVYRGTNSGWTFKYLTQKKYYPAARREENFHWSTAAGRWQADTFKEIYTDRKGRDTDYVIFTWNMDSSEYRRHKQGMTVYDTHDRIIQKQEVFYEEGYISTGNEVLLEFDEYGNLRNETYRSLVGKTWTPLKKIDFTFDPTIICRDKLGHVYVSDRAGIAHPYAETNAHAISTIRSYRFLDGEMFLQEEWQYLYSPDPAHHLAP